VQGVRLPLEHSAEVPEGRSLMALPPCKMMVFQGEPSDYCQYEEAIGELWKHIDRFAPPRLPPCARIRAALSTGADGLLPLHQSPAGESR